MSNYRVFIGAPSAADINADPLSYTWTTIQPPIQASSQDSLSIIYPAATIEAAGRRISLLYQNIIFNDADEDDEHDPGGNPNQSNPERDQTTVITWPPTAPAVNDGTLSFLRPSESLPHKGTYETQESASCDYSDASSIARFPNFQFSLHKVTSLSSLYALAKHSKGSRKISVLLATLEVEGPDTIKIKKGLDAGKEVSILKMILGDEEGSVWNLDVTANWEPGSSITLTASPYNKPSAQICYRTMPYSHEDKRLRPDLRLGNSDATVKKVAALVVWFENMAGLAT
ncbi:hypothetical protein BJ138DRAFT_1102866 [Hygrophoropsis aurantiaca]|uniref:Uncharacterized protein n=1 Tax=Hygrophoropsis aurantiaca TaxID=72124 RepID=A0ACB8A974_9AGAM|nr:hypothetical protein BJ138DRAFT_1102866 [Hygrophoropsis aurantiaca]